MDDENYENNLKMILEFFPNLQRNFCEKWLKQYSGDLSKTCDYLSRYVPDNNNKEGGNDTTARNIEWIQEVCQHNQDKTRCQYEITFTFPACHHTGKRKCGENISDIVCNFEENVILPRCGHLQKKKCFEDVDVVVCHAKCDQKMPCGKHSCNHPCCFHETEKNKKCNVCEELKANEAKEQRNQEKALRKHRYKDIEAEIAAIRKNNVTKYEVTKDELMADGPTAAEYLDVEDHVKKYIQATDAWHPLIQKIFKVTNFDLKLKWLQAKREMFDADIRSALKFHGTSDEGEIEGITKEGFRIQTAGNHGFGVYFASDSSKSAEQMYTNGSKKLLLCDILLGKPLTVEQACPDMDKGKLREKRCDSLFVRKDNINTGGVIFDEFVIFNPHQAYPKYIIHYEEGRCHSNPNSTLMFKDKFANDRKEILPTRGVKLDDALDVHFRIAESQFLRLLVKLGNAGMQNKHTVKKVEVYMNPTLNRNFEQKVKEFETKYGPTDAKSEILMVFHGTKTRDIVENIMDNNFNMSATGKFGAGVYFSEIPQYTFGYGGSNHLILAKILPGKIFACNNRNMGKSPLTPGFDSHGGIPLNDNSGQYNEIVIFNTDQILPCYVIHI